MGRGDRVRRRHARGFATDGTPVDCVRFAELGLIGERPELIVSGINHGANLGDDITYSGTVAAALEGIVLGIPAIAISQQSAAREMDFHFGRDFDFSVAAAFAAQLVQRRRTRPAARPTRCSTSTARPGEPTGIEVTHLGKRLYNDELKLVEEDRDGRRRYQIYGFEPSFEDEEGSDLSAIAHGRIAVTPVHFDLTDRGGPRPAARAGTSTACSPAATGRDRRRPRGERHEGASEPRRCARRSPSTTASTTSRTTRRSRTPSTTTCCASCARSRRPTPTWSRPTRRPSGSAARRSRSSGRSPTPSRCCPSATPATRTSCAPGRSGSSATSSASTSAGREIRYVTEPKVDGLAISLTYEDGKFHPRAPPEATGGSART